MAIRYRLPKSSERFVQLTSNSNGLYALDTTGRVWKFYPRDSGWRNHWFPMTDRREDTEANA
jgi:hypothetical protein